MVSVFDAKNNVCPIDVLYIVSRKDDKGRGFYFRCYMVTVMWPMPLSTKGRQYTKRYGVFSVNKTEDALIHSVYGTSIVNGLLPNDRKLHVTK